MPEALGSVLSRKRWWKRGKVVRMKEPAEPLPVAQAACLTLPRHTLLLWPGFHLSLSQSHPKAQDE